MNVKEKFIKALRSFLKIEPPERQIFNIQEELDFWGNAFANKLWYRGAANELNQFYRQLNSDTFPFWGSVPTRGLEVRKIHTGIPKIIVNTLANIVIRDLNDIEYTDITKNDIWKAISDENKLNKLLLQATKDVLVIGDGACKISLDPELSQYPILEWVPGDRVEFSYDRGRLHEIVFKTEYKQKNKKYLLFEKYGFGYINYELYDGENEVELNTIEDTAELQNIVFDKSFMMAVPYKVLESDRWTGRGQSIYEGKRDNFDALDEAWSQWMHALRASRPIKYIPEALIPRNEENGRLLKPNAFDNQFIATESNMMEGAKNEIEIKQPDFPSDSYLATYITALDLTLQGIISPSTLGIDVKKLDNAEAQREKEKATLYTRGIIIEGLSIFLETLADYVFKAYNTAFMMPLEDIETDVSFGEYANPSFEAVVETLSNPNTPMSIEAKVDEMWGDSKDQLWKDTEIMRIKEQLGITTLEEPALGNDLLPEDISDEASPINTVEAPIENAKTLNGAQTQSLISVMGQLAAGALSEGQAIRLVSTAIGVSREEAAAIIRGEI